LITGAKYTRTARAWICKVRLRETLDRKQINVMREALSRQCTGVMRATGEPMEEVAALMRRRLAGIVAWAQTSHARGFTRLATIRTFSLLIDGKLNFQGVNPHARQPT
jgi:transposase